MITAILNSKGKLLLATIVLIAFWCLWLWQPKRQVQLHQRHFLDAAKNRNWSKLNTLIDADFHIPAGKDRNWALNNSHEVLRQFIALEIRASETTITMEGSTGRVRALLRLEGSGMQLAEMVKTVVNQSTDPFEFTWKRISWLPWDWKLASADHPLMHVATEFE